MHILSTYDIYTITLLYSMIQLQINLLIALKKLSLTLHVTPEMSFYLGISLKIIQGLVKMYVMR